MAVPLEMVALTTSRIYLIVYLIDITNIDKICDKLAKHLNFCATDLLWSTCRGGVNYKLYSLVFFENVLRNFLCKTNKTKKKPMKGSFLASVPDIE